MKLRLVPLSILSLFAISLNCLAQTELVTIVSSKIISQTAPAPDCSGLTGFQAGVCAAQRQSAQTPTSHTYYTMESERNTYVLSCRSDWRGRVPVLLPGQQYTLSVKGGQVLLRAPGQGKALKFDLVAAGERKP